VPNKKQGLRYYIIPTSYTIFSLPARLQTTLAIFASAATQLDGQCGANSISTGSHPWPSTPPLSSVPHRAGHAERNASHRKVHLGAHRGPTLDGGRRDSGGSRRAALARRAHRWEYLAVSQRGWLIMWICGRRSCRRGRRDPLWVEGEQGLGDRRCFQLGRWVGAEQMCNTPGGTVAATVHL
jgi:hypothetical protein